MTCLMTAVTKTARAPKPGRTVDFGAAKRIKSVPASTRTGIKLSGMLIAGRVFDPVYDKKGDRMSGSKYGCPKYCTCRTKRSGKMKLDCKKEPCIAF